MIAILSFGLGVTARSRAFVCHVTSEVCVPKVFIEEGYWFGWVMMDW